MPMLYNFPSPYGLENPLYMAKSQAEAASLLHQALEHSYLTCPEGSCGTLQDVPNVCIPVSLYWETLVQGLIQYSMCFSYLFSG